MAPEIRSKLNHFTRRGPAMAPAIESAFLAQLEDGEDPDDLDPARFATLATRAGILSDAGIDWRAEVTRLRLYRPGFIRDLALKLATGEIDAPGAPGALAELTEAEAEITCRVGGLFLAEVVRRSELPPDFPPTAPL